MLRALCDRWNSPFLVVLRPEKLCVVISVTSDSRVVGFWQRSHLVEIARLKRQFLVVLQCGDTEVIVRLRQL